MSTLDISALLATQACCVMLNARLHEDTWAAVWGVLAFLTFIRLVLHIVTLTHRKENADV